MNSVEYHISDLLVESLWTRHLPLDPQSKLWDKVEIELETEVDISTGGIFLMRERLKDGLLEER